LQRCQLSAAWAATPSNRCCLTNLDRLLLLLLCAYWYLLLLVHWPRLRLPLQQL
jgi:hypothetical protein